MSSTAKLLDRWMKARGLTTQTAAAAALGTKPSTVNNWLRGVSQAAPAYIRKMADDLGEQAAGWVLLVESERARDAADRKALAALAKSLGVAAAVALCAIATPYLIDFHGSIAAPMYLMFTVATLAATAGTILVRHRPSPTGASNA